MMRGRGMGYEIWDMRYGIWDMGYGYEIWVMRYGIWDMGSRRCGMGYGEAFN
jgi:hypothetical protein